MNLAYEEISNEEADRIIKSANLVTLAKLVYQSAANRDAQFKAFMLARSILSN